MTAGSPGAEECAHLVMEVIPAVMRFLRAEMRRHAGLGLSVPQFRTLVYLHRHPGATLSDVAEHLGITLPAMSRLVDRLVERGLSSRKVHPGDRRCVTLALTAEGEGVLGTVRDKARAEVAGALASLAPEQRDVLREALSLLQELFSGQGSR
ncbi:MAG: MarR family transcriptional regulator [Acetobacteraceae bacterium]|nr:MarR family transcriptional regulator [Acetobacteraceae bacterium]